MMDYPINRRQFLKLSGAALGASALACCGLTALGAGIFEETTPAAPMPDITYGGKLMDHKILVTYASQAGSTAGVADVIGQTLSANGSSVDVRPINAVNDLSPYQAVILGSAIHSGKWLPEAQAFVRQHQDTLSHIPTAIFQVCMMMATDSEQYRRMTDDWLDPVAAQIHPIAQKSFPGAILLNQYPKIFDKLGLRIFLASVKLKQGDYRDWDAIRAWANSLQARL
jgi:menaquinone-dependent protoporphyrinogen oxidase